MKSASQTNTDEITNFQRLLVIEFFKIRDDVIRRFSSRLQRVDKSQNLMGLSVYGLGGLVHGLECAGLLKCAVYIVKISPIAVIYDKLSIALRSMVSYCIRRFIIYLTGKKQIPKYV